MQRFLSAAPGGAWTLLLLVLAGLVTWLTTYFAAEKWIEILVGAIVLVVVPTIGYLAQQAEPVGRAVEAVRQRGWWL